MSVISFTDKLALAEGAIVFHHTGTLTNGHDYYLYLAVQGTYLQDYYQALAADVAPSLEELEQFGKILAFGEGIPSLQEQQRLSKEFGIVHHAANDDVALAA